jgi:hypothetical protein
LRRRGTLREISWPSGTARIEWPSDVAIEDGDRFEIVDASTTARATLTFRVIDQRPASDAAWVAEAVLLGCREQIDVALRELGRATSRPELWLTSERGRQPVYRNGEPIQLIVQSNVDGYLFCALRQSDGTAVPIFPAGAIDGAHVRSHMPVSIPGHRRAAELRTGPKGVGEIRCYLADRDIGPELPHALLDPSAARLPDGLAANLDAIFDAVTGTRISKASLSLKIE